MSTVQGGPKSSVVYIGSQIWAAKNLDTSYYANGDPIPQITDPYEWSNLTTGAWCYWNNDPALGRIYGKLYNYYAISDPRGLGTNGWHVPSIAELQILSDYLGGDLVSGGALKESGLDHWTSSNIGATNSSGFTALPGGAFQPPTFYYLYNNIIFWSSDNYYNRSVWAKILYSANTNFDTVVMDVKFGCYIRLIRR